MSGAGFAFRQRTVMLPMAAPAAAAGALIVFLTAFNELTVSALLWSSGAETLGVAVFSLEQGGDSTYAAALATLSVIVTILLMIAASALGRRMPRGVVPWRD
jgi:iron(III) transport system permease protein